MFSVALLMPGEYHDLDLLLNNSLEETIFKQFRYCYWLDLKSFTVWAIVSCLLIVKNDYINKTMFPCRGEDACLLEVPRKAMTAANRDNWRDGSWTTAESPVKAAAVKTRVHMFESIAENRFQLLYLLHRYFLIPDQHSCWVCLLLSYYTLS